MGNPPAKASLPGREDPGRVLLREVGPRDGFQSVKKILPLSLKRGLVEDLFAAGARHIQVASFVNPKKVPQMADAEELCAELSPGALKNASGLALNRAGVERAAKAGLAVVEVGASASDAHSRRNAGKGRKEALALAAEWTALARSLGLRPWAGIHCAFGCVWEGQISPGRVLAMAETLLAARPEALVLADTTGMASPREIRELLPRVFSLAGDIPVCLHLHDTRGLGLANFYAGLLAGVRVFDASFGGLGGCPFVPGAAGNVATEDAAHLVHRLGLETGLDPAGLAACTRKMEAFLETPLFARTTRFCEEPPARP